MKAAVFDRFGPPSVVEVRDLPDPEPRADEVLVRVKAAPVAVADARVRGQNFPRGFGLPARLLFGFTRPRRPVLGTAFSGVVAAVGGDVPGWAPGDEVCGQTGVRFGAHAQLLATPARSLARKPASVTHDQAAGMLFGGTTSWHFLVRLADLRPGERVLVIGGTGAVGSNAVQLARHRGAGVTVVASAPNTDLARRLGADEVIDYATTDVASLGARFDVVLDTAGHLGTREGLGLLTASGRLLLAAADLVQTITARGRVKAGAAPERPDDAVVLLGLLADGTLEAINSATLPLGEIVRAHEIADSGHKVGNVVVHP